jgi:hypothetical protein
MDKQTKILLGVGALALAGYLVWKSSKKTTPTKVYAKDAEVNKLIDEVDKQMSLAEFADTDWIDIYHRLYNMAELNVNKINNAYVVSTKESTNVSNDAQTKAIASLNKIIKFQPSVDFWEQ